jgi:hypothetical protein
VSLLGVMQPGNDIHHPSSSRPKFKETVKLTIPLLSPLGLNSLLQGEHISAKTTLATYKPVHYFSNNPFLKYSVSNTNTK